MTKETILIVAEPHEAQIERLAKQLAGVKIVAGLSERAFAVYVLHAPVLVALTPVLRPAAINPFAGAALLIRRRFVH